MKQMPENYKFCAIPTMFCCRGSTLSELTSHSQVLTGSVRWSAAPAPLNTLVGSHADARSLQLLGKQVFEGVITMLNRMTIINLLVTNEMIINTIIVATSLCSYTNVIKLPNKGDLTYQIPALLMILIKHLRHLDYINIIYI